MDRWAYVRLGDMGDIITGNTPKTSNNRNYESMDINFYKPGDLKEGKVNELISAEDCISEYARDGARILPDGSVLITCIGIIGKVGITRGESACNQQINAVLPDKQICLNRYLAYAIIHFNRRLNNIANAAVVPIVNKSQFSDFEIPLPPLNVQHQIVEILDCASALIEKRKAQIEKLDLLVKSQFIQMFGDPVANPMGWNIGTIRDLIVEAKYGTSKPAEDNGKFVYLRMNNITYNGSIDLSDLKYINVDEKDYEKYVVRKGDILFNRTNSRELVGKTAVFKQYEPMVIAGYIIRVRVNECANSDYISAYLNSNYGKKILYNMCKAIVGQANINAQELQNIAIPLSPLKLQNQFADFVHQVETQKQLLQNSLTKLELQYKSLKQKCFRGEIF